MDKEVLSKSIDGVNTEIKRREWMLRLRRRWYLQGQRTPYQFTPHSFYVTGYKVMKEIEKLKKIRLDLFKIENKK